jgi:hypothetical protein
MDTINIPAHHETIDDEPKHGADTPAEEKAERSFVFRWLSHDAPYILMLFLALTGVIFRLGVTYWFLLIPAFGIISVATGWSHFETRKEHFELIYKTALSWCALMLALYFLYADNSTGVLNANATSLTMLILLALGTFFNGILAGVWRICAVGALLFLAVPGLGWLDQSPLVITALALGVVVVGGGVWWITQKGAV